jgi:predicted nucleic acid-binding protein
MVIPAPALPGELPLTCEAPLIVLDTNVVLDWLVFEEPSVDMLVAALATGRIRWMATASMRGELAHVLGRGLAAARQLDAQAVLATWDSYASVHPEAPAQRVHRCTDPDDQKFVDLALGVGARWLVSRDRAVLKLARRAASSGVEIVRPEAWRLDASSG